MPKFTSDRRFGIEIELHCNGGQSAVANAMEEQGLTAIAMSYGQHRHAGYDAWHVTTDGSLGSYSTGVEVVSPPMKGESAFEQIEKLGKALKNCGATVARNCGFHVHVEAQEMVNECGWATTLMKLFMKYEHVLDAIQPPSRKNNNNQYCKTMRKGSGLAETFKRFGRYSETSRFWGEQYGDKYMKLNLNPLYRQGTVEFRHHSGTVEASKIMAWVKSCIGMVETARKAKNVRAFNPKAKAVEVVFEEDRKLKLDADFNALMKVVKADRQTKKVLRDRFEKNWNRGGNR